MTDPLRDIHGIDPVSAWPLAPGWWFIILASLLLLLSLMLFTRWLILYPPGSWRREARTALIRLRRNAKTMPDKQVAADLSEILRRIAMAQADRKTTAGISGDAWLEWLSHTDPEQFDWNNEGEILLTLPYAPTTTDNRQSQLQSLIDAALRRVARSRERKTRSTLRGQRNV